jgi:hypothetical protein
LFQTIAKHNYYSALADWVLAASVGGRDIEKLTLLQNFTSCPILPVSRLYPNFAGNNVTQQVCKALFGGVEVGHTACLCLYLGF